MNTDCTTFTLDNGLRVIHQQDSATAMVALNLLYNTGARDEDPRLTGLAHLIEHLMFSGSANVDDFDGELQRAGGSSNAWTGNDFTCFYEIIPAVNIETAFWVESDRMLSPKITVDNLEVQRSVVIEEFKQQCLNRPYGDLAHHLRALAYKCHPYRWPVIGLSPEHLQRVTVDDVYTYWHNHYSPSNAVLAITGNITAERCCELAEKWMADIPRREVAPRLYGAEPLPDSQRCNIVSGHVPYTAITRAYPMDRYGTMSYYAADAITDILSNGQSSRFEQELVNNRLFTQLDASITGAEEPGMLLIDARIRDNSVKDRQEAITTIDRLIETLCRDGVTTHEVERAKNKYESQYTYSNIHFARRAQTLATALMHNETPGDTVKTYRSLTPEIIDNTARTIFNPSRSSTIIYCPQD